MRLDDFQNVDENLLIANNANHIGVVIHGNNTFEHRWQ